MPIMSVMMCPECGSANTKRTISVRNSKKRTRDFYLCNHCGKEFNSLR